MMLSVYPFVAAEGLYFSDTVSVGKNSSQCMLLSMSGYFPTEEKKKRRKLSISDWLNISIICVLFEQNIF